MFAIPTIPIGAGPSCAILFEEFDVQMSCQPEPIPFDPSHSRPTPSPIPYASDTYFTDYPLCPACVIDDGNCTVSCSHCKLDPIHTDCLNQENAYCKTLVQYSCARDEYCRKSGSTEKLHQGGWRAVRKQGADMIRSSIKHSKTIEKGNNVRMPIPYPDRASIGTIKDVYSYEGFPNLDHCFPNWGSLNNF
ncbi:hypothetical protein LOD99_2269 [Oopsacas minuta]|uniref:Uncharacterized protein n=1 Tax=Oopsacas minuta TaxID=111878 RepID=A0AAV7K409_9METZ|nr:hypothetical protein LOD99_2269 [Oopsacas minuta]